MHKLACSDYAIAGGELHAEGTTLTLTESRTGPVDCLCCFQARFEITGLAQGDYSLRILDGDQYLLLIALSFAIPAI